MTDEERLESLRKQLENQEENLLRIEEQMSVYVLDTDIPVQLKKAHNDKSKEVERLKQEISKLLESTELLPSTDGRVRENQKGKTDVKNAIGERNDGRIGVQNVLFAVIVFLLMISPIFIMFLGPEQDLSIGGIVAVCLFALVVALIVFLGSMQNKKSEVAEKKREETSGPGDVSHSPRDQA